MYIYIYSTEYNTRNGRKEIIKFLLRQKAAYEKKNFILGTQRYTSEVCLLNVYYKKLCNMFPKPFIEFKCLHPKAGHITKCIFNEL